MSNKFINKMSDIEDIIDLYAEIYSFHKDYTSLLN